MNDETAQLLAKEYPRAKDIATAHADGVRRLPPGKCIVTHVDGSDYEGPQRVYFSSADKRGVWWTKAANAAAVMDVAETSAFIEHYRRTYGDWERPVQSLGYIPKNEGDVPPQDIDRQRESWKRHRRHYDRR